MTKEQLKAQIWESIDRAVRSAPVTPSMNPPSDWASTQASIMKVIIDGIMEGVAVGVIKIEEEIRADVAKKAKTNEMISYINMLHRYASGANSFITLPTDNDKLGNLPYTIKPLT